MQSNPITYDYASFSLTTGQTDYDVKSNQAALFSNVPVASRVVIKTTQTITVKFNNTGLPAITVNVGESPLQLPQNFMEIVNIYLTNSSGATSTIDIWLA